MQKVLWWVIAAVVVLAFAIPMFGHRDESSGEVHSTSELLSTSGELSRAAGTQISEIRGEVRDARSDSAEIRRLCGEIQRVAREGLAACSEN